MLLRDRVAVVTGGGRGIGRAIAEAFHAEGARVVVAGRNTGALQTAAAAIGGGAQRVVPLRCDVTRADDVQVLIGNVVELWGRVDILVNNAGVSGMTPILDGEDPDGGTDRRWHAILDTNLTGMYHCVREAVRHLPADGTGRVLNVSSVLGKFGVAGYSAYCASKHGVIGFTRALALELAPRRVTVNALCPGWVDTEMARRGIEEGARREGIEAAEFRAQAESRVPLGRFIEPAEVARLAVYVASDAAAGMTGQAINLDGGAAMW